MSRLAVVFKLDKTGFNLRRGVAVAVVGLIPLIVLSAIHQEKYFVSMIFAVLFLGGSDPGGEFGYRMSHMALFAGIGALLTALGFGIGSDAWGWVVLAVFAVTLVAGLAVKYGLHRFVSALLLNIWFAVALSVQAGYRLDHTHTSWWAQALAWLIGSALVFAYVTVMWLARGRTAQQQPVADVFPGSTDPVPLTRPVIMFAVIRAVAVAAAAAIAFGLHQPNADWMPVSALDLPHPSNLADEGRRILYTFLGVGIAVLVMFLASQLAKRTPAAQQAPAGQAAHGT